MRLEKKFPFNHRVSIGCPDTEFRKGHVSLVKGKHWFWSEEARIDKSGRNHPRWIKDRNTVKMNERNDPEYKQWVKKVKKRDHNICRLKDKNCAGYNIAHHIKSWSKYPRLRYIIKFGITLCQAHHPKTRAEEKRLEPVLMALVSASS